MRHKQHTSFFSGLQFVVREHAPFCAVRQRQVAEKGTTYGGKDLQCQQGQPGQNHRFLFGENVLSDCWHDATPQESLQFGESDTLLYLMLFFQGGAILPDKAELFLAPVKDDGYYRKRSGSLAHSTKFTAHFV